MPLEIRGAHLLIRSVAVGMCVNFVCFVCFLHTAEMIEITAKLPRRSVFLAGETIE